MFSYNQELQRFYLDNEKKEDDKTPRKVTIVYSGGDDLFIVGAWNEVLEAAVDIRNVFERLTDGALTFSAGFCIFEPKYPVSRMAEITASLESRAKSIDKNKNAISLFGEQDTPYGNITHTYKWDVFINSVINEKLREIQTYFGAREKNDTAGGNAFLYRIMSYVIGAEDKINIARCAYLLARLEPNEKTASEAEKKAYSRFSRNIYKWILNEEDRRQLLTAISLYIYLTREKEDEK